MKSQRRRRNRKAQWIPEECTYSKPQSLPNWLKTRPKEWYRSHTKEYQSFAKDSTNHHQEVSEAAMGQAIDLKPDGKPYAGKANSLDNNRRNSGHSFENLEKRVNWPSTSPWWLFLLFEKRMKLRPPRYRRLNKQNIRKVTITLSRINDNSKDQKSLQSSIYAWVT